MKRQITLADLAATQNFAHKLGAALKGGEVITFASDLGGGKTTLIKSIVAGTGSQSLVSSPTFTICNQYLGPKFNIQHFDFYRLKDPGIMKLELEEKLNDPNTVVLIEWPRIINSALPKNVVHITIKVTSEIARELTIDYPEQLDYLFKQLKA